jgi:predicted metalloprotease with PDZ domain
MKINMTKIARYLLGLSFAGMLTPALGQSQVNYKVFYTDDLPANGLKVQISRQSQHEADSTCFFYANKVWGEANLSKCVHFMQAENPGYKFRIVADSNRIIAYHPRSKNVSFYYRIRQDYPGDSVNIFFHPRVQAKFFHILGESLFMVPEELFDNHVNNPVVSANIEWADFPHGYVIHNSFGSNQKRQVLNVDLWRELYHSLFIGGDYRIYQFQCFGKPVYFATRGDWQFFKDEKVFGILKNAIATQRTFWDDKNVNYYTVIMTPTVSDADTSDKRQSISGTSIKQGFFIQSSNNPNNGWDDLKYLFNHELMHDWIGGKIKMSQEELDYWFSEGFTDYYAYKNRLRDGDIGFKEWLDDFNNNVLASNYKNPERNQPNASIKQNYWDNRNFKKIPYKRGAIFAFWLDNQILIASNYTRSLDDLMRDLLKTCSTEHKTFTNDLFLSLTKKYLQRDITDLFQKYILAGADIDFNNENLVNGFTVEHHTQTPEIKGSQEVMKQYLIL